VRREIARLAEFTSAVERIIEVNEAICEARPAAGGGLRARTNRNQDRPPDQPSPLNDLGHLRKRRTPWMDMAGHRHSNGCWGF